MPVYTVTIPGPVKREPRRFRVCARTREHAAACVVAVLNAEVRFELYTRLPPCTHIVEDRPDVDPQ
jgi:hypothetical protein